MIAYDYQPGGHPELFARNSVFLAASVTGTKPYPDNLRHRESARPQWIRDAVLGFARTAFRNDYNLVFGAHPSISPMILQVAREFPARPGDPRVVLFQSEHFRGVIPDETLELADGTLGVILWTEAQAARPQDVDAREASLEWMRRAMFTSRGLTAGAFIGGMNGILDEAQMFKRENPGLPTYALGSTGGAAADLLDRATGVYTPDDFTGAPGAAVDVKELGAMRAGYVGLWRRVFGVLGDAVQRGAVVPRG